MVESAPALLVAEGQRVRVSPPRAADIEPYRVAVERSARRIGVWNPVNPRDLTSHLNAQSDLHRTFLIRAKEPVTPEASLIGVVNVSNVVRGRALSATLGYNAFDPYAGTGMFREGLGLIVGIALRDAPTGMGLHRVEANVQLGNAASAGVLRALGFRRERTLRRMLWLADGLDGPSAWRDHDSYAVTRDEWPAAAHAAQEFSRGVLVLGEGVPAAMTVALARELGATPLVGVPFDVAYSIARRSGAPVLWSAGAEADRAVRQLHEDSVHATRVDREVATLLRADASSAPSITRAALAVRPYLD